jgi:YlmC/YmxH family sporulation protein
MLKISEFQTKDVVNISDGKKLGTVCDLEIDLKHGRVDAIVCPGPGKFFGFLSNGQDLVIPWRNIVKIGADVILVRLDDKPYLIEEKGLSGSSSTTNQSPGYRPYTHS